MTRPDAELLCELLYCHRDRLRALKPDSVLGRKLSFFNEGRREAVHQRNRLSNAIKSQLKVYFPLALELLDQDTSTALAADLLFRWPTLEAIQKPSAHTLRKFFYGHNCRATALGLKPITVANGLGVKATMPRCARSLSNGSASSLLVGNSAPPTTLNAICRPSNIVAHPLPMPVNNSNKFT